MCPSPSQPSLREALVERVVLEDPELTWTCPLAGRNLGIVAAKRQCRAVSAEAFDVQTAGDAGDAPSMCQMGYLYVFCHDLEAPGRLERKWSPL